MNGNGCAGSMASGVSTGNTRSMNQASSQARSSADSSSGSPTVDAGLGELARAARARPSAARPSAPRALVDLGELLRRRAAVRLGVGDAGLRLADQAGDAHRVELVEVVRADREEAQPLQQRMAGVLGLVQTRGG